MPNGAVFRSFRNVKWYIRGVHQLEDFLMSADILPLLSEEEQKKVSKNNVTVFPRRSGEGSVNDEDATFPKSAALIQFREQVGSLSLQDLKVLNCLLYYACDDITDVNAVHEVQLCEIRRYLGKHGSNDRIRQSLKKLSEIKVDFDVIGTYGGKSARHFAAGSFISIEGYEVGEEGIARYQFHFASRKYLKEPAVWARVSLFLGKKFQSKYGARLHENLEIYANRRKSEWEVDVDELKRLIGANDVPEGWGYLRRRCIEPAMKEVNEYTGIDVDMVITQKIGKRVTKVRFIISKKSERKSREANAKITKKQQTGEVVLKEETYEIVRRKIAPGADVYAVERDWRGGLKMKGITNLRNPDAHFKKFAKGWFANRQESFL